MIVKNKQQAVFPNNEIDLFNAIFGNVNLKSSLFGLSNTVSKAPAQQLNTSSSFYNFIKAE